MVSACFCDLINMTALLFLHKIIHRESCCFALISLKWNLLYNYISSASNYWLKAHNLTCGCELNVNVGRSIFSYSLGSKINVEIIIKSLISELFILVYNYNYKIKWGETESSKIWKQLFSAALESYRYSFLT